MAFEIPRELLVPLKRISAGALPSDLESETLEFKADRSDPKTTLKLLTRAAACLANGTGGTLVLGVEDDKTGPEACSGTKLDLLEARRGIFNGTSPPLTVAIAEHSYRGSRLLVIQVPVGAAVHDVSGVVRQRIGRSCQRLAPDQIAALVAERQGRDPSSERSGRPIDEADPEAMALARRHLRRLSDDRARWADLSDDDLCRALGVAEPGGRLLVAGEQLLCRGRAEVVVYQHRAGAGTPPDSSEHLGRPLITAFDRTLAHIAARNRWQALHLPNGQQLQLCRHPPDAVREAVANALVHRRLDLADPVHVEHSDDLLSVTSSGPFVSGVTVDNILTTASRPRNRLLARAFRNLGLIEELGTGIPLMFRSMLQLGKEPPAFEVSAHSVRVSLAGGPADLAFARFVAMLDQARSDDMEMLLVLRRLCLTSSAAPSDVAPLLQRPPAHAARVLDRMAGEADPLIEPTMDTARGSRLRYRLSPDAMTGLAAAVKHRRHSTAQIERAVRAHVREHGSITNRAVRNLLGVGAPRASAILRALVQRRMLKRTSEASRGPSVEYGPGPAMTGLRRQPAFRSRDRRRPPRRSPE